MAQQAKQGKVGAREGFPYNSVVLVLLANGNRYEVDSKTFFLSGKPYAYENIAPPQLLHFLTHIRICSL
jgi:hypothetical protein